VRLPAQTLAGARPPRHPLLDSSSLLHSSERCTIRPSERARQGEFRNVQWTCRGEWASRDTLTPARFGCWLWRKELPAEPAAPDQIERDVLNKRPSKEQDTKIEIHSSMRKSNRCWRHCQAFLKALRLFTPLGK